MAASEQALLLLEALSRGDVGIFLSCKPLFLFTHHNGVKQIVDVLRLHYPADSHFRQEEALALCADTGGEKMVRALDVPSSGTKPFAIVSFRSGCLIRAKASRRLNA